MEKEYIDRNAVLEIVKRTNGDYATAFSEIRKLPVALEEEFALKSCPFCGGTAKFFAKTFSQKGVSSGWEFGIYCTKCDVTTPRTDYKVEITFDGSGGIITINDERPLAADTWNRRVI